MRKITEIVTLYEFDELIAKANGYEFLKDGTIYIGNY